MEIGMLNLTMCFGSVPGVLRGCNDDANADYLLLGIVFYWKELTSKFRAYLRNLKFILAL